MRHDFKREREREREEKRNAAEISSRMSIVCVFEMSTTPKVVDIVVDL